VTAVMKRGDGARPQVRMHHSDSLTNILKANCHISVCNLPHVCIFSAHYGVELLFLLTTREVG